VEWINLIDSRYNWKAVTKKIMNEICELQKMGELFEEGLLTSRENLYVVCVLLSDPFAYANGETVRKLYNKIQPPIPKSKSSRAFNPRLSDPF
jgi:hypothetical protein